MLDRGATTDSATARVGEVVNGHADGEAAPLEQRVRHLEDAVAQLQDTEQLEERVATRVTDRISQNFPIAVAQPAEPGGFFGRLPRALLPLSVTTINPTAAEGTASQPRGLRILFDWLAEFRAVWRMYVDSRFRLTWVARVVAPALLVAILTSWIWLPVAGWLPSMLATLYVKVADLVLAFFLYKALSREARRYRDAFPDMAAPPGAGERSPAAPR